MNQSISRDNNNNMNDLYDDGTAMVITKWGPSLLHTRKGTIQFLIHLDTYTGTVQQLIGFLLSSEWDDLTFNIASTTAYAYSSVSLGPAVGTRDAYAYGSVGLQFLYVIDCYIEGDLTLSMPNQLGCPVVVSMFE